MNPTVSSFLLLLVFTVFTYNSETCASNWNKCSSFADCRDYSKGYCCHCRPGFYGNGKNCVAEGEEHFQRYLWVQACFFTETTHRFHVFWRTDDENRLVEQKLTQEEAGLSLNGELLLS